jgi:4-hydroxy-3-methylbut-2-enyl diphosphate reductase
MCIIVNNVAEAEQAAVKIHTETNPHSPIALIGQTTISAEEYQAIGNAIAQYFPQLEIAQTICTATRERQDSLRELLDKVDAVIVAGGKDSANTRRLFAIAQASGKPCALVETVADIPPDFYTYAANGTAIGLSAGASTPDALIEEIERELIRS